MRSIHVLTPVEVTSYEDLRVLVPEVDERAARRSLLDQIAKLETELSSLFCATYPRTGFDWRVPSRGGPRMLGMEDLEQIRDQLADRLAENRALLGDRTYAESRNRRLRLLATFTWMLYPLARQTWTSSAASSDDGATVGADRFPGRKTSPGPPRALISSTYP